MSNAIFSSTDALLVCYSYSLCFYWFAFRHSCSSAVIYTPQNEHFGIVPLEAMVAGRPVIACNSGGPVRTSFSWYCLAICEHSGSYLYWREPLELQRESIVDGKTGWLCEPTPEDFARSMQIVVSMTHADRSRISKECRQHVVDNFSRDAFGQKLEGYLNEMCKWLMCQLERATRALYHIYNQTNTYLYRQLISWCTMSCSWSSLT